MTKILCPLLVSVKWDEMDTAETACGCHGEGSGTELHNVSYMNAKGGVDLHVWLGLHKHERPSPRKES